MPTLYDVAKHAGVSTATVSNVMTGAKHVRPEIQQRVLKSVKELNYTPLRTSKTKQHTPSKTLGIIMTQLDCVFFPLITTGIQKIASEFGYDISFYTTNYFLSTEKKHIETLVENNVAGIILDTVAPITDIEYFKYLSTLNNKGKKIPVVSIQADLTDFDIPSITLDSFQGGYMATNHLIEQGCKKIVSITGPTAAGWAKDRLSGYKQCLTDNNLSFNSSYIYESDCSLSGGYQSTNFLLMNAFNFDGMVIQNDLMTIGALKALKEHNYKIPEDIKLVGYDNVFISSLVSPSITSIHVPKQRLGEEAARYVIRMIQGNPPSNLKMDLPLSLIKRQTTDATVPVNWDLFLV